MDIFCIHPGIPYLSILRISYATGRRREMDPSTRAIFSSPRRDRCPLSLPHLSQSTIDNCREASTSDGSITRFARFISLQPICVTSSSPLTLRLLHSDSFGGHRSLSVLFKTAVRVQDPISTFQGPAIMNTSSVVLSSDQGTIHSGNPLA